MTKTEFYCILVAVNCSFNVERKKMRTGVQLIKTPTGSTIVESVISAIRSGSLKPGDKLRGESELARQYSESVYSVRKAIQVLKQSGYLYSIPKNGVFVRKDLPEDGKKVDPVITPEKDFPRDIIRFSTGSFLSEQKKMYEKIADSFASTSLGAKVECVYDLKRKTGECIPGDLYEFSSQSPIYQGHTSLMDMKRYFSETVRFRERMIDNTGIPLYYSLPILLYNRSLLKEMGFGEKPDFHDYESMICYLDEVTAFVACNPRFTMPGTSQNIIHKFGREIHVLLDDIRNKSFSEKEFLEKYYAIFRKVTMYWKKYHISYPGRTEEHISNFTSGKTPFFFGYSSNYLGVKSSNPEMETGAAVMYSFDNTVNGILAMLAVDTRSCNLLETIRVAQHFQKDEFQNAFAANGLCPMEPEKYHQMPYDNAADLVLSDSISRRDFYIAMNVVNVELWNIVLFDKSIEEAIRDILVFSRSYLEMNLDHAVMAKQKHWAELYQ